MDDATLADEIITRLNGLLAHPDVCEDIMQLINVRVSCSDTTDAHPSIQVRAADHPAERPTFGFLGLLNGLVGAIPDGPRAGYGYVTAEYGDDGKLVRFVRTDAPKG